MGGLLLLFSIHSPFFFFFFKVDLNFFILIFIWDFFFHHFILVGVVPGAAEADGLQSVGGDP